MGKNGFHILYIPQVVPDEPVASLSEDSKEIKSFSVPVYNAPADTPPAVDLHYPIHDRVTDFLAAPDNSFDLQDPSNVKKDVEYDPQSNQYIINETMGDQFYRNPSSMSFEDFLNYQYKQSDAQYWKDRSNAASLLSEKGVIPDVNVNSRLFDRIFGGTHVDIRPQGNIDLTFGGNFQNILNPTLTRRQQRQGGFEFAMQIQMNVIGKIGDKLKLTTNYNTESTFNFENQVKLDYTGYDDEIIKKIEAGNIQLPLHGTLIQGSQSLFGLKTQLQFGRLTLTGVVSQQQSQSQNITVQGGAQTQVFRLTADQYDENRNFLLAQYFRNHYNGALAQIPIINSGVTVNKIEVWVTNKTGATVDVRDVVAFADLGEPSPYRTEFNNGSNNPLPYAYSLVPNLNSNSLYPTLISHSSARSLDNTIAELTGPDFHFLIPVQDFEKTYARKLSPTEYTFDPRVGYLMLNQQLSPDDVLGVAYQYTYNGQVYQVGEFAQDIPPNTDTANVLFLKMLKATSVRTQLPIWQLMMKNVYSLGAFQVNPQDFYLDVYYYDPGGGEKRYIPADNINGKPLIQVLGLDRLNSNNDPQPDGVFDFIPGITINPANGKVIFPVLEPFGKDLASKFSSATASKPYVYQVLYDSTKTVALQFPEFNRYALRGSYKSSVSSEISLGAFNVPEGSVTVTAGGQRLIENADYTVDYNLGRVKILNQGLLNSGIPVSVAFENNATFGILTKTLFGVRADYYINDHLSFGGTLLKEWERPFTNKVNVGEDPISNAIYGVDGSYTSASDFLTSIVDKIPFIETKEKSTVSISGEAARLQPGHSKAIGKNGTVYIDDFEGTSTTYDLRFPFASWGLASTPQDGSIPFATAINDWRYGFDRSKLSWYNIDPYFWGNQAPAGIKGNYTQIYNLYSRQVLTKEIFPKKDVTSGFVPQNENTFDLRYEPRKRGPYNFDTTSVLTVGADGSLQFLDTSSANISKRWAGIQRSIDQTDFEEANVEYIQLWMLDPFGYDSSQNTHGDLYIDLGNISEDVLRDSKFEYENGVSPTGDTTIVNRSVWGYSAKTPPITNAFDNDPNARQFQDVGYDGVKNSDEANFFKGYINNLALTNQAAYQAALADPSNDNYRYYADPFYDAAQTNILDRYSKFNGPDGNSPVSTATSTLIFASTNEPESEDLNHDNSVNENEQYFQYHVRINPVNLRVGQKFVTDAVSTTVPLDKSGGIQQERWIQIKIPITDYEERIGGIPDFRSIRFIRTYLSGFDTTIILRFDRFELVRNQWRKYDLSLKKPGESLPDDNAGNTFFNVTSVSLEENSERVPIRYTIPPGIQREQIVGQTGTFFQNEQSLSLQVCNLQDGDSRAVYKNINLDLRTYQALDMFVHAEASGGQVLNNGDITAFMRLGTDFVSNYYEYEVPLTVTLAGTGNANDIWPISNDFHIILTDLVNAKEARNLAGIPLNVPYTIGTATGARVTIIGNPDLGVAATAMLGIRNPKNQGGDDDGASKCAEAWFDELRLSGLDESGGYAAIARADIKLADLGTVALSGAMHTIGFGQIEQQVQNRFKDNFNQYDVATNLQLGKFFPKTSGIVLPLYAGISKAISNPQYDPYDHDILLKEKLNQLASPAARAAARKAAETYSSIGSVNFTNIRKVSSNRNKKLHLYSPENLNLTLAYTRTYIHTPIIQSQLTRIYHGELGYTFPGKSKFITPFGKVIPSKSKWLKIIRDINFNPYPTNLSFRTAINRQIGSLLLRPITSDEIIFPTYNKYFTWDRFEGFKWDLTRGLSIDFNAAANTRIDEPDGLINTQEKKDSVWNNIKKLGRTTNYLHSANVTYTLPLSKIPILDWTQVTARYGSNYNWLTGPLVFDSVTQRIVPSPLGNTISNNQNVALNGELNLRNLYNKSKFLKKYDTNAPSSRVQAPRQNIKNQSDSTQRGTVKNQQAKTTGFEALFVRLPLMLKRVSASFSDNHNTTLPGYLFKPKWIGQDFSENAPGWDFIFGYQPDSNWLNDKARKGWISNDTTLNYLFIQNKTQALNMKASLEPFKDFLVDLNFMRSTTDNLSEYFKRPSIGAGFEHLSRQQFGTFSMSYLTIKTAFTSLKPNQFSSTFLEFENNRTIISQRLGTVNPFSQGVFNDSLQNYSQGYGPYSQDVLIPAFLAAYSKKDANKISLGLPFKNFPIPNWRITYNGLGKYPWAKKIWNSVNVTHAYNSTLSVGAFASSLNFRGNNSGNIYFPSIIDPNSQNFISFFAIPAIAISEQFAPLIGIDLTWKNSLTTKLQYNRGRNLGLSLIDYQLTESRNQEVTGGIGYKFQNVPIPFKVNGKKKRLKNDVNFLLNISYADNLIVSEKLDQAVASLPTGGIQTISISPSFDYTVSNTVNVHVFFDKRYSTPKISNSFPIRYTDGGVTIRLTLQK